MQVDRRAFLRGKASGGQEIRPPHACSESRFASLCDGCAQCIPVCPTRIIELRGSLAALDFSRGECTLCNECVRACPTLALSLTNLDRPPLKAGIGAQCLTIKGIECRLCGDPCEPRAIRFIPTRGGIRLPQIDLAACTGCGACFAPCPVNAIEFTAAQECTA